MQRYYASELKIRPLRFTNSFTDFFTAIHELPKTFFYMFSVLYIMGRNVIKYHWVISEIKKGSQSEHFIIANYLPIAKYLLKMNVFRD